jgi:hypothetical protein
MLRGDVVLGVFCLRKARVEPFTDNHIDLSATATR